MYKLPNGKYIDEKALLAAFLDYKQAKNYYLDSESGEVLSPDATPAGLGSRFFLIPSVTEQDVIAWMTWMARELVPHEDIDHALELLEILKRNNPIENFHKAIEGNWSHGWPQCEQDMCYELIEAWLESLPIDIEDAWHEDLDCDCGLCRLLIEGVNDEKAVKDAFREEKFKQIIGPFQNKHNKQD